MKIKLKIKQTLNIFIILVTAILITACSGNSDVVSNEPQKEEQKVNNENAIKGQSEDKLLSKTESQDKVQKTKSVPEDPAVYNIAEATITLNDFINRWNEIEPGRLSVETETNKIENGIRTGMGMLGNSDSYIFELNQADNTIRKVSLNLTYEENGEVGESILHDVRILMDVLEPKLSETAKEQMIKTLIGSHIIEVSVRAGIVTYSISKGDDRFWLDATFVQ